MAQPCRTCHHADRERIEVELAMAPSVREVAERYDIPRRTLHRHRQEHMTAEQIARIRGMAPSQVEVNIEELTRRGGEAAVLGFTRLIQECQQAAETCDKLKMFDTSAKYRKLQLDAYREQAKIAAIYPSKRGVTNNNLVVADGAAIFAMVGRILASASSIQEARTMLSAEYRAKISRPAIEVVE